MLDSNKKTRGIVYILIIPEGDHRDQLEIESQFRLSKMIRELCRSQSEVHRFGDLPITLITNLDYPFLPHLNVIKVSKPDVEELSSNPVKLPRGIPLHHIYGNGFKIKMLSLSPYDQTIYLDLDTFILSQFTELFDYLKYSDLAIPVNGQIDSKPWVENSIIPIHTMYDTGVFAYNNNDNVKALFNCWFNRYKYMLKNYHKHVCIHSAFTEALLFSNNVRALPVSENYNLRTNKIGPLRIDGTVKIVHDRTASDMFLSEINKSLSPRIISGRERLEKNDTSNKVIWPADQLNQLEACLWVETYLKDFETFNRFED